MSFRLRSCVSVLVRFRADAERDLYLQPPPEGLKGVEPGSLLVPRKAIYGFADAPRCFSLKLEREARAERDQFAPSVEPLARWLQYPRARDARRG